MNYQKLADELDAICRIYRESIKPIVVTDEHFKIINRLMRQKKMTKAEAFEWLKWKKIVTEGKEQEVLEKLFSIGFTWKDGATERLKFKEYECFGLSYQNTGLVWWGSQYPDINQFNLLGLDAIGADDVLGIEIVEEEKKLDCERNEHVKALQELIAKSGCIDCIIISKNDVGILKK